MGIIDVIIIILLALLVIFGLVKGFIKQAFNVFAWIAAVAVPFLFTNTAIRIFLNTDGGVEFKTSATVFVILFVVTFVIVKIIGHVLSSGLHKSSAIGALDRLIGAAWGLVKGLIIISVVFLAADFLSTWNLIGEPIGDLFDNHLVMFRTILYDNNLIIMLLDYLRERGFELI